MDLSNLTIPTTHISRVKTKNFSEEFIKIALERFKLIDRAIAISLIHVGYDDLNFSVRTNSDRYILKFFNTEWKTEQVIYDYVKVILECKRVGIPVSELVESGNSVFIEKIQNEYCCVIKAFDGDTLEETKYEIFLAERIAKYLGQIHSFKFEIANNYDSWGTKNFGKEYEYKVKLLDDQKTKLVDKALERFKKIKFSKLEKSVIHGDIQKKHVLKNKEGDMCIIDFGCANFDFKAMDVSIFIAQVVLDPNLDLGTNKDNAQKVIDAYLKIQKLTDYEKSVIPDFIISTFAMYLLSANYVLKAENDDSQQTLDWIEFGARGLETFLDNL